MKGLKRMLFVAVQIILAAVFVVYVIRYLTNMSLPYVTDDRSALLGLLIVGFFMCCVGILFNLSNFNWANGWIIVAAVVGTALLFILAAVVFKLINFDNYKLIFYLTAGGILIKITASTIHHLS